MCYSGKCPNEDNTGECNFKGSLSACPDQQEESPCKGLRLTISDELFARARLEEICIAIASGVFTRETVEPELSALIRIARDIETCEYCDYYENYYETVFQNEPAYSFCPNCGRKFKS